MLEGVWRKGKLSCTIGGNDNSHYREEYGDSLKNYK